MAASSVNKKFEETVNINPEEIIADVERRRAPHRHQVNELFKELCRTCNGYSPNVIGSAMVLLTVAITGNAIPQDVFVSMELNSTEPPS